MKTYFQNKPRRLTGEELDANLDKTREELIDIRLGKPAPRLKVVRDGDHIHAYYEEIPWERPKKKKLTFLRRWGII